MADEKYTFSQARVRLEEIVAQVRKKDVSLEKSIELLEEGVRLANQCTELSDHSEWQTVVEEQQADASETDQSTAENAGFAANEASQPEDAAHPDDDRDGAAAQPIGIDAGE